MLLLEIGRCFWAENVPVSGRWRGPLAAEGQDVATGCAAVGAVPCLSPAFVKICCGSVLPTLGERKREESVFHAMVWLQDLEDLSYIAQSPESSPWQGHQLGSRVAALSLV